MFCALICAGFVFSSCNQDAKQGETSVITEQEVQNVVSQFADFKKGSHVVEFKTGYYELNCKEARYKLRQLAANGVISYSAEIINEVDSTTIIKGKEKIRKAYVSAAHVFVNVELTDAGKTMVVVDSAVVTKEPRTIFPSDMENNFANEKYPADAVAVDENIPVRNPVVEDDIDSVLSKKEDVVKPEPSIYELELKKVVEKKVMVNTLTKSVCKVSNLIATKMMKEQGLSFADVIFETSDVTPFGRILEGKTKGVKEKYHYTFQKYEDGWKIVNEANVKTTEKTVEE